MTAETAVPAPAAASGPAPALAGRPFWYLRHGETDWNALNLSQGRTDNPLNARGRAQAHRASRLLCAGRARFDPISRIVVSPLGRALETAAVVAAALARQGEKLVVEIDPALQEVRFGDEEGKPMGPWYDDWIAGRYTPSDAETFAELRDRTKAAIDRITAAYGPALVVGHGGMFRALRSLMGLPPNVRLPNAEPLWLFPDSPHWQLSPLAETDEHPATGPAEEERAEEERGGQASLT